MPEPVATPEVTPSATPDSPQWGILDALDALDVPEVTPVDPDKPAATPEADPDKPAATPEADPDKPAATPEAAPANPFKPGTKQHAKWGELKKEAEMATQELANERKVRQELEAKIAKGLASPDELLELKKKNEAYEQRLMVADLQATEAYQTKVIAPLGTVRATVETLASTYDLDQEALHAAIVAEDPKVRVKLLAKMAETMLEPDRLKFFGAAQTFEDLLKVKDTMEADAAAFVKKDQEARENAQREAAVRMTQETSKALDDTFVLLGKKSSFFADPALREAIRTEVSGVDIHAVPATTRAVALVAGAALPKLIIRDQQQVAKIAQLEAQVKALTAGGPGPGGAGSPTPAPKSAGGFLDSIDAAFNGR